MAKMTLPVQLTIGTLHNESSVTFDVDMKRILKCNGSVISVSKMPPGDRLAWYLAKHQTPDGPTFLRMLADVLEEATVAERSHV